MGDLFSIGEKETWGQSSQGKYNKDKITQKMVVSQVGDQTDQK